MENSEHGGSPLVSELARTLELARRLGAHLEQQPSSSREFCKSLAAMTLCSIEKSIGMAKLCCADQKCLADADIEPPHSGTPSPESNTSDQPFKCLDHKVLSKKRKTQPKWRNQVRVSSVGGVEGLMEDGHGWRKYGQKYILGTKYPRGYYRCTHRNSQGCPATKQVQRTDDDPSVFNVIYQGTHICIPKPSSSPATAAKKKQHLQEDHGQDLLQILKAGLTVKTQGLASSFPSTPGSSLTPERTPFSPSTAPDDCCPAGFTPLFASPATPELNYFSVSTCRMNECGGDLGVGRLMTESYSPIADLDIMLDDLQFGTDFQTGPSDF